MLVFSHKMVFIENEPALLCVIMRERARGFAATIQCLPNSLIQILPLKGSVFVVHFSNAFWHENEAFPKVSSQNEIVPLLVIFHLPYSKYRGVKMFLFLLLSTSKFFTCVALVLFVQHSCRTRVFRVALGRTRVAFVSGTRVLNQTRSFSRTCSVQLTYIFIFFILDFQFFINQFFIN